MDQVKNIMSGLKVLDTFRSARLRPVRVTDRSAARRQLGS